MNILVIEDDENKLRAITDFLTGYADVNCSSRPSYNSGMQALSADFDLLLLDMTLPSYDVAANRMESTILPLAGRDILFQMRYRRISVPAIVITQYEDFDGVSLKNLDEELAAEFPQIYKGYVYYNVTQDEWKEKLAAMLKQMCLGGNRAL